MKTEVIYQNIKEVPNCWVYSRFFTASIITWVEKREIIVKKWSWKCFAFVETSYYKYFLHQNNPKLTTTTYDGEYSTNSIIDSLMSSEIEKAKIWFAENIGNTEIEL